MAKITVEAIATSNSWQFTEAPELRIYALQQFVSPDDGTLVLRGTVGSDEPHLSIQCSLNGDSLVIPSFEIDSTPLDPPAYYTAILKTADVEYTYLAQFAVPDSPVGTTWGNLITNQRIGNMRYVNPPLAEIQAMVASMIAVGMTFLRRGSESQYGMVALTKDATDPLFPIAVGANDPDWLGLQSMFLNVKAFGAAGNGVTDDTAAINEAIAVATDRGGGVVYFPRGIYKVGGAFDALTNSLLTFPAYTSSIDEKRDVWLVGECWDFAGLPHPKQAVVIDATGVVGSGTQPAIIAPKAFGSTFGSLTDFSAVQPHFKNLRFLVSENPSITGLQLHNCTTADLDNVTISVDSTDDTITQPTNAQAYGVILPGRGNDTQIFIKGGFIQGFYNGVGFSEHFKPWGLQIRKCKQALVAEAGFHINTGQLLIEQCGVMMSVEAASRFDFEWVVERNDQDAGQWFAKQAADIVDAGNLGVGSIRYVNALSYTGVVGVTARLTRSGGFNVALNQIDFPTGNLLVVSNSANISIPNNTATVLTFDTDDQDYDGAHSTSVNTDRINAAQAGLVNLSVVVRFAANATGVRTVAIRKWISGTPIIIAQNWGVGHATLDTTVSVSTNSTNSLGHYFDVLVYQDSGGALNALAVPNLSPKVAVMLVAP